MSRIRGEGRGLRTYASAINSNCAVLCLCGALYLSSPPRAEIGSSLTLRIVFHEDVYINDYRVPQVALYAFDINGEPDREDARTEEGTKGDWDWEAKAKAKGH